MNPSILLILLYIESSLFFFLQQHFFITNTPMIDKVANISIPKTIERIIISNLCSWKNKYHFTFIIELFEFG